MQLRRIDTQSRENKRVLNATRQIALELNRAERKSNNNGKATDK